MLSSAPNLSENVVCGFVPSVLSRVNSQELEAVRLVAGSRQEKRAVFNNICIEANPTLKANRDRAHRTKNRKYITHSDTIKHQGIEYQVNAKKSGICTAIMHRFIAQLDIGLQRWRRVLAVRFDLHQRGVETDSNKWLSKFNKNLKRRLERAYGISDIGFIWVRELEAGKAQHYHAAIWVDGDKIQHPKALNKLITETWQAINPACTVFHPENCFYFVDSQETKEEFVYRTSYLAKARGKGYRAAQVKDYGTSRLGYKPASALTSPVAPALVKPNHQNHFPNIWDVVIETEGKRQSMTVIDQDYEEDSIIIRGFLDRFGADRFVKATRRVH